MVYKDTNSYLWYFDKKINKVKALIFEDIINGFLEDDYSLFPDPKKIVCGIFYKNQET